MSLIHIPCVTELRLRGISGVKLTPIDSTSMMWSLGVRCGIVDPYQHEVIENTGGSYRTLKVDGYRLRSVLMAQYRRA